MWMRRFLLLTVPPVVAAVGLWACVVNSPDDNSTGGGTTGFGGFGGSNGTGGTGGTPTATSTIKIACMIDMADPLGFCTQKLVLKAEHKAAFSASAGVAQSWDSTTMIPDQGTNLKVLHAGADDVAYSAAVTLYLQSAMIYGDNEINATLSADLNALQPLLMAEVTPPPASYAGELYQDLRTTATGYRLVGTNDMATAADMAADAYGTATYTTYFTALAGGDAGAPDAGGPDAGPSLPDGILGTPAAGGGIAYAPDDVATGALTLIDMAVRHAAAEPASAFAWQEAAAEALQHIHLRARDPQYGLYYAALVTSADPAHDALAPAAAGGLPADALLTDVAGRVALALTRAQALVTQNPTLLPSLIGIPLEQRAEDLLAALDAPPKDLWDTSGGISDGDGGVVGTGYFTGYVPSTGQLLTDKQTRANANIMAALHRATVQGDPANGTRVYALRDLLSDTAHPNGALITVVPNQNGYFVQVPRSFTFQGADAGGDTRWMSYFASANAYAIEGLNELLVGLTL